MIRRARKSSVLLLGSFLRKIISKVGSLLQHTLPHQNITISIMPVEICGLVNSLHRLCVAEKIEKDPMDGQVHLFSGRPFDTCTTYKHDCCIFLTRAIFFINVQLHFSNFALQMNN